jgi:hypothetical protein
MIVQNWFNKKWGVPEVPIDVLLKKIEELENRIVKLEEENVEFSNLFYETMNSIDAVDSRIDILTLHHWTTQKNEED